MSDALVDTIPSTSDLDKVDPENGSNVREVDERVKVSKADEYEELFKNRYTLEDPAYAKIATEGLPPVITVFPYEARITRASDYQRGGYRGGRGGWGGDRGGWRGRGRGHWQDRGEYSQDRRRYDQGRREYDQNRGGYGQNRGGYGQNRGGYGQNRGGYDRNRDRERDSRDRNGRDY